MISGTPSRAEAWACSSMPGTGSRLTGENYLVPVDAKLAHVDEVEEYCIRASAVLRKMETAGNRLNIIILDACRNNPFASSARSADRGLARMDAPTGSILAYATSPGDTASDGTGQNGLYTSKLLKYIPQPGLRLEDVFIKVRNEVRSESQEQQTPWETSSLTGPFYFSEGGFNTQPSATQVAAVAPTPSVPTPPPAGSTVNLDDVIKQRAEAKKGWENWQSKMAVEYKKLEKYDASRQLQAPEKADAWAVFLQSYGTDNPYSADDEALRAKAQQRMDYWRTQQTTASVTPVQIPRNDQVAMAATPTGKMFTNKVGMKFALIPPGTFMMGSPESELGRESYEVQHQVTLTKPYYLAVTEVTQRQFKTVMGSNPSGFPDCGDGCPVENQFLVGNWPSSSSRNSTKWKARQRTDCPRKRNGSMLPAPALIPRIPVARPRRPIAKASPTWTRTAGIAAIPNWCRTRSARKKPNRWGLYDMHGNVYEWCDDWWYDYSTEAATDPKGESQARHRMLRGGCFYYYPTNCRSAYRYYDSPTSAQYYYGFRVARDAK